MVISPSTVISARCSGVRDETIFCTFSAEQRQPMLTPARPMNAEHHPSWKSRNKFRRLNQSSAIPVLERSPSRPWHDATPRVTPSHPRKDFRSDVRQALQHCRRRPPFCPSPRASPQFSAPHQTVRIDENSGYSVRSKSLPLAHYSLIKLRVITLINRKGQIAFAKDLFKIGYAIQFRRPRRRNFA